MKLQQADTEAFAEEIAKMCLLLLFSYYANEPLEHFFYFISPSLPMYN